MDDKQLQKLIRQDAAKAEKLAKARKGRAYDPTLDATRRGTGGDEDSEVERAHFFKEMKRREF